MYIYDALYGKIEFPQIVWKCMMTPEIQRLREVRLCNINSLCITGSSNTNRFEHSVGTAYLAALNALYNKYSKEDSTLLIVSALLHDVANGPFGHSYEYLMEKQGFVPEKGLKNVFTGVVSFGQGAHGYSSPYEQIYFGQLRELNNLFNEKQKEKITNIIAGNHYLSRLISDKIDLDNIDNVFRMAYHMGIPFPIEAPIELAKSMYIKESQIVFKVNAEIYLNIWYETRRKVYKFLLLNPQEFAGKYMLTEAMDIVFENKFQNNEASEIKWYYTDFELLQNLYQHKETWIKRKVILKKNVDISQIGEIYNLPFDKQKLLLKQFVENIELSGFVKDKGKSGNSNRIVLTDTFKYTLVTPYIISIIDRNMHFEISDNNLYKITYIKYNPSHIISRLATGDLYDCLMIIKSTDIGKYNLFLDYSKRILIEDELECIIKSDKEFKGLNIGIHPILDVNKTERQLNVIIEGNENVVTIGKPSKDLLLGIFLKNEPFGLKHAKIHLKDKRLKLQGQILNFFRGVLDGDIDTINLYEEADEYGK